MKEEQTYSSGRSTNWTGKVGLMYPSDYEYATSGVVMSGYDYQIMSSGQ